MRPFRHLLIMMLLALPSALVAQSTNAALTGLVDDSTKAVIVGAQVTAINAQTGSKTTTTTNRNGSYVVPDLVPGTYRIEVDKQGFKGIIEAGLVLHVQDVVEINFHMAVGSMTETVTVSSNSNNLNTTDGSVSTVVDRNFVENIPLNGRSFQTLIMLTPGVVVTPTAYGTQGQFSVNGQRADSNYFSVDGTSANSAAAGGNGLVQSAGGSMPNLTALGSTQTLVSADAMQEFRIETSSFAPEFGRTPGAQISIATRSGENQWHGTAFEYLRNDVFDANNWFGDRNHIVKPKERQNNFGGVLGGPIRKDHAFFFFSYEGLRLRKPLTATTLVPSSAARAAAPAAVQPLMNLFPVSSNPDLGNGLAQYSASYSDPATVDAYSIRIDQNIGSKMTLFGRYSDTPNSVAQRDAFGVLSMNQPAIYRSRTVTLGFNEGITSSISNEIRINYSNDRAGSIATVDSFGGATPSSTASLFQTSNFPAGITPQNGLFSVGVGSAGATIFVGANSTNEQRQINFVDNVSVVKGTHQLKMGVDYRWLSPISDPRNYLQLLFFSGVDGGAGSLMSGVAQEAVMQVEQSVTEVVKNFSLFGQDTWKVTPKLTITYGLRWDVNPAPTSKDSNHPLLTVQGLNNPSTMALAPPGTGFYPTTYGNVAPRLGVAYALTQKPGWASVVRGGFGVFYDLGSSYFDGSAPMGFPFSSSKVLLGVPTPLTPAQALPAPVTTTPPVTSTMYVTVPDFKLPRTMEVNAAIEQSLGTAQSASLTYVGAIGRDLSYNYNFYQPDASFSSLVSVTSNLGNSDYHSLEVKFQRQLLRGLQALGSYTWSHSIDTGSSSLVGDNPGLVPNPNIDRGASDFDVRNSFTGAVVYDIPSPAGRFAEALLGGWSLSDFMTARSAPPVNVSAPIVIVGGTQFSPRPNVVSLQPFYLSGSQYPGGKIINKAAFTAPPAGIEGNFTRNSLRGFGAWQMDFAVQRQFRLTERLGLQFRSEFFNIFNHPNFGPPLTTSLSNPLFGQSTATLASSLGGGGSAGGFSPLYQIGGPRSIQFAMKLVF